MTQYDQLSDGEKMRLNRFLSRCEKSLNHLSILERGQMINVTRDYLLAQISPTRRLDQILLSHRDPSALLNQLLISQNLPLITKKRRSVLGPILLAISLLILLFIYGIYWGINRAYNWFESNVEVNFDSATQSVQINDGKIRFGNIDDYPGFDRKVLQNTQQGEIKDLELNSIDISAQSGVLYVTTGEYFSFNCKTDRENYNPLILKDKKLKLELAGRNQCELLLPPNVPLSFKLQEGVLKITGLAQSFTVEVDKGTVFWESKESQLFDVESKVSGLSINTGSFAPANKGKFHARFDVQNGVLKIK